MRIRDEEIMLRPVALILDMFLVPMWLAGRPC